jgi:hypothetical protein
MYITSTHKDVISGQTLNEVEEKTGLVLPVAYRAFLETYGRGTYDGGIIIHFPPDTELLKQFVDYEFWNHEDAPVTRQQIGECAVIGYSIDTDYFAIHKNVNGLILFPRHSEEIALFAMHDTDFCITLNEIITHLWGKQALTVEGIYFESHCQINHLFLHYKTKELFDIAQLFKASFKYDHLVEDQYICIVFLRRMGGYVRFNYHFGFEVAIFYDQDEIKIFNEVEEFLKQNGCVQRSS